MKTGFAFWLICCLAAVPAVAEVYHGVACAPDGSAAWVVTIETTAVYHSPDFGPTWLPQTIPTIRDFFDVDFVDGQRGWTCGRIADIWFTSDGGESWTRQNLGGPKFATRIRFLDERYGWAAGGEAILLHTANGGEEWQMEFFPDPPFPNDTVDFQGLALIDSTSGYLVAGRFPEGDTFARGQGFIVRHTVNGASELLRRDDVYDFYDVAVAGAGRVWVAGGDDQTMRAVVLHSMDGGMSWQQQTLPSGARFLRSICFVDADNGWACGRNGTIIHTTNGGRDWVAQYSGVDTTLFDIEFIDTQRGMVAGNSVVLYTTDGGATWRRGLGGIADAGEMHPLRPALRTGRNPVADATVSFTGAAGPVRIYNSAGVLVRTLPAGVTVWDRRDATGHSVAGGLYLAESGARSVAFVLVGR